MKKKPIYSAREANRLIKQCDSTDKITAIKNLLMQDIESYSLADQGFLLAMLDIQTLKIDDSNHSPNWYFQ